MEEWKGSKQARKGPIFPEWFCPILCENVGLSKSWFSGRGWGQQLFSFQSPAVHWIARTSSPNCLSCKNPYQTLANSPFTELPPPFSLKNPVFCTENCFVASPSQKSAQTWAPVCEPPFGFPQSIVVRNCLPIYDLGIHALLRWT